MQKISQDYVHAHIWFNLGAASGDENAMRNRDLVAKKMSSQQITKAQKMASDCQLKNSKDVTEVFISLMQFKHN